jgi:uncharacterized RDD family membrane protein YckC
MEDRKQSLRQLMGEQDAFGMVLRRWLGCWLDFLVAGALLISPLIPIRDPVIGVLVGAGLVIAYFIGPEAVWGRTIGKLATGLIVVDEKGRRPSIIQVVIRTLTRLIEVNPFLIGGIPAGIVVLSTGTRQRLGDLFAGTYVLPISVLRAFERQTVEVFD